MLDPLFILIALTLIMIEAFSGWVTGRKLYSFRHTLASLVVFVGWAFSLQIPGVIFGPAYRLAADHTLFTSSFTVWSVFAAVIALDFGRYWHHRASHFFGWLWAEHAVHHSSTELNVASALRQGWFGILTGTWLLTITLIWIGFDTTTLLVAINIHLLWELLIHNEWVGRLGPLERIFMTPANHRAHHGIEPQYRDRNFGGVTVIWDQIFGTYVSLSSTPTYGLVDGRTGENPARIVVFQWKKLLSRAVRATSWSARWRAIIFAADRANEARPRNQT